jgi:hypothetical protein
MRWKKRRVMKNGSFYNPFQSDDFSKLFINFHEEMYVCDST